MAKEQGTPVHVGTVVSSDVFYSDNPESSKAWRKMGVLCAEMECAALFMNAARAGKEALGILTLTDSNPHSTVIRSLSRSLHSS